MCVCAYVCANIVSIRVRSRVARGCEWRVREPCVTAAAATFLYGYAYVQRQRSVLCWEHVARRRLLTAGRHTRRRPRIYVVCDVYWYVYVNVCVARSFRMCTWTAGIYRMLLWYVYVCVYVRCAYVSRSPRRASITGAARWQWRWTARDAPPSTTPHPL